MNFELIHIAETDSTNRWLRDYGGTDNVALVADSQTAGKGCGTNTWESEAGKNLTYSVLLHPQHVPANRQFLLTVAMALAVKNVLDGYLLADKERGGGARPAAGFVNDGDGLTVKWPNDIYWHDRKLGGILTEGVFSGERIKRCIIGVGVNLNQTTFRSDAPNPVSMAQLVGPLPLMATLQQILQRFGARVDALESGGEQLLMDAYWQSLYRREGFYRYRDAAGEFEARIERVCPQGHLVLGLRNGEQRHYAFKEVTFII